MADKETEALEGKKEKKDLLVTELLYSLPGPPLRFCAKESHSFSSEKGRLPLPVWNKDGLVARIVETETMRPAG